MPQQPLTVVKSEPLSVVSSEPLDTPKSASGSGVMQGVSDFLSSFWKTQPIHPIDTAVAVGKAGMEVAGNVLAGTPTPTVSALLQAQGVPFAHAEEAFKKGDYAQGVTSLLNWLIPVIGPQIESAQQRKMSGQINWPQFAGESAGIGLQAAAPGALKNASLPAVPAIARNANPVQAEAVAFGQARGIPVDAATATGNRAISAVQNVADRSLGGWMAGSGNAAQEQANALSRVGGDLAAQASPAAVTPEQAGTGVTTALRGEVGRLHAEANTQYDKLRAIEQQTPLTVDVSKAQQALKPIHDSLMRQLPLAQRQASPGLQAIGNILDGPKTAPLSQVETDLSAIKALTRGAEMPELRGVGQGVAAKAVSELDNAVIKAASADPDALAALKAGRAATAQKYQVAEVLSQLRDEPVRVFQQSTYAKDAGIDQLRQVAKIAPAEMPKIGRAFLDDMLNTATAEGGFDRARTLATKWENLGPQTKALLFKDPAYIKDLDRFFLLAKKIGENPNQSGTAHTVLTAGQSALIVTNPLTGIASTIGTGALSKLLHNPAAVRALTNGLQVPISNRAPALAVFGDLNRALETPAAFLQPVPAHAQKEGGGL